MLPRSAVISVAVLLGTQQSRSFLVGSGSEQNVPTAPAPAPVAMFNERRLKVSLGNHELHQDHTGNQVSELHCDEHIHNICLLFFHLISRFIPLQKIQMYLHSPEMQITDLGLEQRQEMEG